jgi:cyclase
MNACVNVGIGLLVFLAGIGAAFAQQPSTLTAEKVANNLYVVKGGVANTGFLISDKEVLAIDAEMTVESAKQMLAEIKKLTPKPVTRLVLTHSDGDHVNGIGGFPQGLEIIAHVQTKKDMADASKDPNLKALQSYLPSRTFTDKLELQVGSDRIQLLQFGPAHTSCDTVVFFQAQRVAFVGDLVFVDRDPLVHLHKGGTTVGLVKTLKALLELNVDQFVPGHGRIVNKKDIESVEKNIEDKQAKIKALIQEGRSLAEIKKTFGIVDRPSVPGAPQFPSLVELIYTENTRK